VSVINAVSREISLWARICRATLRHSTRAARLILEPFETSYGKLKKKEKLAESKNRSMLGTRSKEFFYTNESRVGQSEAVFARAVARLRDGLADCDADGWSLRHLFGAEFRGESGNKT